MLPRYVTPLLAGVFLCSATAVRAQAPAAKLAELTAEPAAVTLRHAEDRQRLLVTGKLTDGVLRDLSRAAKYASSDPQVVRVSDDGVVAPVAAGQAVIQIIADERTATVNVSVTDARQQLVSFANDIMPLFAKAGCNSGACHGAASGKKGFKISLRGYDPSTDYQVLTRGTTGRRLNFNDAASSLLLLKPTGATAHEGGKRFDAHSAQARTLQRWIEEGARSDVTTAPKLTGIEVSPSFRTFDQPNQSQRLLVTARFSDGTTRDVTDDARFSSSNELVATVDEAGLVGLATKGESAIMARYGDKVAVANLVVMQRDPLFAWTNPAEHNYIDRLVHAKLKHMEILPSDLCSDEEFLRRAFYDTIGLPPTPEEVRAFLADTAENRRAKAIDALLERPEHAEYWALKWTDLFKLRFDLLRDKGTWGMYRWVRDSIAVNKPYDVFVKEIIVAEGSCAEHAPANFWRVFPNGDDASEAVVQVFLGIRLMCAKCHDHPFEKWVQKDYYGMSAFFSQVARKPGGRREDLIIHRSEIPATARHPNTGETLQPKFLDGAVVPISAQQDGRDILANWLTAKENPFFAKATVNRLWSHLFGKGIIDPVDDIRSSNPAINQPLLDALAKDFTDRNFDVRHILRTMLNSRTYQLSARTNKFNADDKLNFSRALPRRLSAEQLLDTLTQATGVRENFRSRYGEATVAQPNGGLRAGQLPDRMLTAEMLDLFGRPRGESTCACERHEEASMTQALHLINGKSLGTRLASPNGRLAKVLATPNITTEKIVEELYLIVLCRMPKANELELLTKHFQASADRTKAAQDAMWVLFNTKEFLFNH
ncbi:MAG: DUF1553 domain-containing protein [Planctomycetia bacterium]|nr:DUF1553 domain-containing protein [Planctomycetia bacterium]